MNFCVGFISRVIRQIDWAYFIVSNNHFSERRKPYIVGFE